MSRQKGSAGAGAKRRRDAKGRFVKEIKDKINSDNCPFTDVEKKEAGMCIAVTPLGIVQCDNFDVCYPEFKDE